MLKTNVMRIINLLKKYDEQKNLDQISISISQLNQWKNKKI